VWKARDTRLGRIVAIKCCPPIFQRIPKSRARFEREARAISQLSHPNICSLHDIGRQEDVDYLVMEYLEVKRSPRVWQRVPCRRRRCCAAVSRSRMPWIARTATASSIATQPEHHADQGRGETYGLRSRASQRLAIRRRRAERIADGQQSLTAKAPSSAHFNTWRPSSWKARKRMHGQICGRSAACCTRWRPANGRSRARARRA